MRSLAEVLLGWGWRLSGSDLLVEPVRHLADAGVDVRLGHASENVPAGTELVVCSDAVGTDNPERRRAQRLGIPVLSYFEMLGRLMSDRFGLAVAGTHGKSTTTAMLGELLASAGLDPTVVYGAAPLGRHGGGRPGRGELMVVEACEYRTNFLRLPARQVIVLGIEPDHFDCYDSLEDLERAFAQFVGSVPTHGLVLAPAGGGATERVTAGLPCPVETFGLDPKADWSARLLGSRRGRHALAILRQGSLWTEVRLRVPGTHNMLNALAAAALASHHGVRPDRIAQTLGQFRGIARRLEVVGCWRGVTVVDDYAHHPTEVSAALRTVRRMYPGRRLWAVFQPHQASRTARLLDELAASLQNAERVVVTEVFRAREPAPRRGDVTAVDLARQVRLLGAEAADVHAHEQIVALLERELRPGDVLVLMGAGDIGKLRDALRRRLQEDRAAG